MTQNRYYFAEFTSVKAVDDACKELDGLEMGHLSADMDLRVVPEAEASTIQSNYAPPDFVVAALQQTNVKCKCIKMPLRAFSCGAMSTCLPCKTASGTILCV